MKPQCATALERARRGWESRSWSLIRLRGGPTGMTRRTGRRRAAARRRWSAPGEPADLLLFLALRELGVRRFASALKPDLERSASATTPRMTGIRRIRLRLAQETVSGSDVTWMSPLGLAAGDRAGRTPRVITPSSTAWPPTGASPTATGLPSASARTGRPRRAPAACGRDPFSDRRGRCFNGAPLGGPATKEPLDPAAGVNQLLLARIEGVALRTDAPREARPSVELAFLQKSVAARAMDIRGTLLRDGCLSSSHSSLARAQEHGCEPLGAEAPLCASTHVDIQTVRSDVRTACIESGPEEGCPDDDRNRCEHERSGSRSTAMARPGTAEDLDAIMDLHAGDCVFVAHAAGSPPAEGKEGSPRGLRRLHRDDARHRVRRAGAACGRGPLGTGVDDQRHRRAGDGVRGGILRQRSGKAPGGGSSST